MLFYEKLFAARQRTVYGAYAINKPQVAIKFSSKVNALKPPLAGEGLGEEIPNKQLFYLIFQKLKTCLFPPRQPLHALLYLLQSMQSSPNPLPLERAFKRKCLVDFTCDKLIAMKINCYANQ